tara:strand:+ start:182 stop:496 length:315 start_codon:yes stop_codon:yes gene_type:complete
MSYNSNQIFHTTEQCLIAIPWSERGLMRLAKQLIKEKRDVREMGLYRFNGMRSDMWDVRKLADFLISEKLDPKVHFDYEKHEQEKVKDALVLNFNNKIIERKIK